MDTSKNKIYIGKQKNLDNEEDIITLLQSGIDVTANELENYSKNEYLKTIINTLKESWCMGVQDREENVRIGTVKMFTDDDGFLHLDFTTRFKCTKKQNKRE